MQTLVLHTSADKALLEGLSEGLLMQRSQLRRQGIGLHFAGLNRPRQQWEDLAEAMADQNQQAWLTAMSWQRRWPRDIWLCAKGFHRSLLRDKCLNRWRDWLESQQLELVVAVHLLQPREQSWQRFVAKTLRLEGQAAEDGEIDQSWFYNRVYNSLIETAGVRGSRFLLHSQASLTKPPAEGAGLLDWSGWPVNRTGSGADLRLFALSLALAQQLRQPPNQTELQRLRRQMRVMATQLPPVNLSEAQALALKAGWKPPGAPGLSEDLRLFARRVWGTAWPEAVAAEPTPGESSWEQASNGKILAAAAHQLLQLSSS